MDFYRIDNIKEYIEECCKCYFYYVDCHMSLRETSKELALSRTTVQRRLEGLKEIDEEMYNNYINERGVHNAGRKPRDY